MARKVGRTGGSKPFSASTDVPSKRKPTKSSRKDPSNAYTYLPSLPKHHRTSEQTLSLTRDEALEAKAARRSKKPDEDDEGNDMEARIRKVAMMIAGEDIGEVESDESDVDSDIAWEEGGSDDERWGDVFRDLEKGKKGKSKTKKEEKVLKVRSGWIDWRFRTLMIACQAFDSELG
jgi:U3 small nucleolar RNA-associated protein 14